MKIMTQFDAETLSAWRAAFESAWDGLPEPELGDGWSVSGFDPATLLMTGDGVRLQTGFKLALYLYRWGGDGNGITWALPADVAIPTAADCPLTLPPPTAWTVARMADFDVPRPPHASGDLSSVLSIQPDSPEAHLRASLLLREWSELGAVKHGQWWSQHALIDAAPSDLGTPIEWTWAAAPLDDLRPQATQTADGWRVTFYSMTAYGGWRVFAHDDQWGAGGTHSNIRIIASAPGRKRG